MSQKLPWQHQTVCRSRSEFRTTMCDVLVALPPATGGDSLFAKNSDRPPHERQILEWIEARSEKLTRATYVEIKGHETLTQRCIISRCPHASQMLMGSPLRSSKAASAPNLTLSTSSQHSTSSVILSQVKPSSPTLQPRAPPCSIQPSGRLHAGEGSCGARIITLALTCSDVC